MAIAYKFKAERVSSILEEVTYQVGRTGAVTPVANLQPVQLGGTTVKRASLHNADQIAKLNLHERDEVYVEKGGEIIPKIVGVNLEARAEDALPVVFIEACPECGTTLKRTEGEAQHYCPNDLGCRPQIIGKIDHFISRKALNIDGLGTETVSLLVNKGLIENYADLYKLTFDDIIELDRMADKSANNMLQGIEASKKVPFEKVLFGLGIRFVGETVAKKIAQSLLTIDRILTATYDELVAIDEIGDKIALSIIEFAQNEENRRIIEELKAAGLQLETVAEVKASNKLEGLKIVISGVFEKFSRNELKAMIEDNGGKNVGSISAKTSYLVAGDNMGPAKLEKANKLGVEIISELDLEKMITGE